MTKKAKWIWTAVILLIYGLAVLVVPTVKDRAYRQAEIIERTNPRQILRLFNDNPNKRLVAALRKELIEEANRTRLDGIRNMHILLWVISTIASWGTLFVWTREKVVIEEVFPIEIIPPDGKPEPDPVRWIRRSESIPIYPSMGPGSRAVAAPPEIVSDRSKDLTMVQGRKKRYWPFFTALLILTTGRFLISEFIGPGLIRLYYSMGSAVLLLWLWPWGWVFGHKSSSGDIEEVSPAEIIPPGGKPDPEPIRWVRRSKTMPIYPSMGPGSRAVAAPPEIVSDRSKDHDTPTQKNYLPFWTALIILIFGHHFIGELPDSGLIMFFYCLGAIGFLFWLWPKGDDVNSPETDINPPWNEEPEIKATRWVRAKDYEDRP